MYAVVKTGGKQYRVAKDDKILVERLEGEAGQAVQLNDVMMVVDGDKVVVGTPQIAGASVAAEVVEQTRGPKIIIFRRKRRKNHRRTQGHRQDLTLLKITGISPDGAKPAAKKTAKKAEAAADAKPAAKKAAKKATKKAAAKKAAPKAKA